jgi:CheY-like chemotaxis protein
LLGASSEGSGPVGSERQARAREVITRQVDHLAHLVDDLLDVARISEGKIVLRTEEVDLGAVVAQAIETAGPLIAARGHHLDVQLPEQQVWVMGDPVRLAQSVGNLLHNAAKFTPKGGELSVRVSLLENERVQIAVRDNGIGIAEDNLPRIFGMFAQVDVPPDRAPEGLGIGLSLVSHLIELHGGRLSAQSPGIGMGSTFTVDLPLLRVSADTAGLDHCEASKQGGSGMRVLLVDDNVDAMEMMGFLLAEMGYETCTTSDAAEIEGLALRHKPQVIVLDIGLPGIDGYEVARRIKKNPALAHIRLVAHTGYGSPEDRRRAMEAGFDAHLVKPAELPDLEKALKG